MLPSLLDQATLSKLRHPDSLSEPDANVAGWDFQEGDIGPANGPSTDGCESVEAMKISPFTDVPREIMLNIFGYLDSISLCRAAQVSTRWKDLAGDDLLWRRIYKQQGYKPKPCETRPWKMVYRDRIDLERNWRHGRFTTRTLTGHTKGVTCLQFSEFSDSNPVLISGSHDSTVRIWDMVTGLQLRCLTGHTQTVSALQFDQVKLITGSWDHTLKIWDWRSGECLRTLNGHSMEVICLDFHENLLASGSRDKTINIWNLETGSMFTLADHDDWVMAVQLWNLNLSTARSTGSGSTTFSLVEGDQIKPGTYLFSVSFYGTINLWDLNAGTLIYEFLGYYEPGLCRSFLSTGDHGHDVDDSEDLELVPENVRVLVPRSKRPLLLSESANKRIKLLDIETAGVTKKYSGHTKNILAVVADETRLLSGSYDDTIKVWSRKSEECIATLDEHMVNCLALGDDKFVSGSNNSNIKIWSLVTEHD